MNIELLLQLKEALTSLKGLLVTLLIIGSVATPVSMNLGGVLGGEEVELKWLSSYETIAFDTMDGDLGLDEYAINPERGWYIRSVAKNIGNFDIIPREGETITDAKKEIAEKKLVNISCERCSYYSEFITPKGVVLRERILDPNNYKRLADTPNYPQPSKKVPREIFESLETNAAVTFNASSSKTGSTVSSLSWSHTAGSGSDRLLTVHISYFSATVIVSSSSYNGVLLTNVQRAFNGTDQNAYIWRLINPASGSHTAVVTFSGNVSPVVTVADWAGVDQTTPISSIKVSTSSASSVSLNVDTVLGDIASDVLKQGSGGTIIGANQTLIFGTSSPTRGYSSYEVATGTITTMSWSDFGSSVAIAYTAFALKQSVSGGVAAPTRRRFVIITED